MFEVVRDRLKVKEEADAKQKKLPVRKPYTLPARQTAGQMQLSPDGKYVLAVFTEAPNGTKNSNVPTGSPTHPSPKTFPAARASATAFPTATSP